MHGSTFAPSDNPGTPCPGDLAAELAGLLLLELATGDDVVEHLGAVDVFEEYVPMVVGADDVAEAADVGVV